MMVPNLQMITENDNMILLQNEDWFLSWGYLKGKFHHYKMKIGFYHQVTWRDTPPLQNEDWFLYVFIIRLLEGNTSILQNEDWFLSWGYLKGKFHHYKMKICFYHQVTWRGHSTTTKWGLVLYVFITRLLEGNTSEGQLPLLQNEIVFLHVVFRWENSLATKWLSIFKGLSTTETLNTYKMQFPSCGYKMPGPSPFFHLNLSPEMPLKRGTRPPIL